MKRTTYVFERSRFSQRRCEEIEVTGIRSNSDKIEVFGSRFSQHRCEGSEVIGSRFYCGFFYR